MKSTNLKVAFIFILFILRFTSTLHAQETVSDDKQKEKIYSLIDMYAFAREKKDTVLLKRILAPDIDQLVSTGEWRKGMRESVDGMMKSSDSNPGTRKFIIENVRFLNPENAIVDARYEIKNTDGTERKMWSTFIVVFHEEKWKITAIRNMLPSGRP
ncbi:MAG TPA: DUF4440 domain-containing protein [Cyclobacteriaceae bacterium]|nr:DUF4440 domain-containing protein [Cyclobacteriaceae bacterium]